MKRLLNIQSLLWLALSLALAGSLRHVAHVFYSIDKNVFWGWVQSIAVDAGLLAIALGIMQRRRVERATLPLWLGIALFSGISVYANLAYGLEFSATVPGWIINSKPYVMAATLPILVLYLAEIVGSDANHQFTESERVRKIEERKQKMLQNSPKSDTDTTQLTAIRTENAEQRRTLVLDILRTQPDTPLSTIAQQLDIARSTLYADLNKLSDTGLIQRNDDGIVVVSENNGSVE